MYHQHNRSHYFQKQLLTLYRLCSERVVPQGDLGTVLVWRKAYGLFWHPVVWCEAGWYLHLKQRINKITPLKDDLQSIQHSWFSIQLDCSYILLYLLCWKLSTLRRVSSVLLYFACKIQYWSCLKTKYQRASIRTAMVKNE